MRHRAVREVGEVVAGLRGAGASRERDELARLLAKAMGYRIGALKEELPAPGASISAGPSPSPASSGARQARVTVWPYREDATGLVWVKERTGQAGRPEFEEVPLTNFTARVTAEVTEDDGAEERRMFEVTGRVGNASRSFRIPSNQFGRMEWVIEHLGATAIVEPGSVMRERTRHAIQVVSGQPPQQRVYTHLGWRRLGDAWVYLHAGGAIGSEGPVEDVLVRLEDPLDRFALPDPPEGDALANAVWACLRTLEVAPKRLTVPLLAAVWRAVLGEADLSVFLYGGSGYHKTCLAALAQQCFGPLLHHRNLPGNWESSANALEGELFFAKDALFVIDDFIPAGSVHDRARRYRDADRVLRGQGNRAGRQRMRPDATLRPVRRSRALVVSTGEELPRGESLTARMLVLPVGPSDVNREHLTRCQADADAGLYSQAMSGFLRWLAPRFDEVQASLRPGVARLRREVFARSDAHGRLAESAANLFFGLEVFLRFVVDLGLYAPGAAEALLEVCRRALLEAMGHQVESQRDADPLRRFFELLTSALASGRAHVAGPTGKVPRESPLAWGWRLSAEGKPEREPWKPGGEEEPYWHAQGERIGWVDGEDLWLEPEASHLMAQRVAGEEGYPVSQRALRRRMKEAGLLKAQEGARDTCCVRASLGGTRRSVLHLDSGVVLGERVSEELFAHG